MRPPQSSVTPAVVHEHARAALRAVHDWAPYRGSVTVRHLLDLILLVAATARTLHAVAARRFPFGRETARKALRANLPDTPALTAGLVDALHAALAFSRRDRRRRWVVAIDTHDRPFYGDRDTAGTIGGQKKAGARTFFRYATAVLLHRRRRYTVGLVPILAKTKPHEVVRAVLDQIAGRGLTVRGVVLDAGFDSGDTLLLLQSRNLAYAVPLSRKGRSRTGRNTCFGWASGTVGEVGWVTERGDRRAVTTTVVAWEHRAPLGVRVYAFSGWAATAAAAATWRARTARRKYRERFGIETSYRQKNQALGWTTSTDPRYRLLLEGVAHLLRQVWVRLTEILARARGLRPTEWVGALPLADMLEWLADYLKARYKATRVIPIT